VRFRDEQGVLGRSYFAWLRARYTLLDLAANRASLGKAGLSTGGLAQNGGAGGTEDNGVSVREHSGAIGEEEKR